MRGHHDQQLTHRMSAGLTLEDLEGADEELFRLSRGLGRLRLQVGLALAALGRQHRELGFRTLDAYAKERVSRSGRWAGDLRSAAARIAALPRIFAALWSGELSWSMAELLSRHATAEDEAELLEATEGMTVRAAVEVLRERGGAEEESERLVTLQISLPSEDALLVQRARWLIEAMEGVGATGWFELLLAEGSSSLLEVAGDDPSWDLSPDDVVALQRRWLAARQQAEEERARQEERAAPHLPVGGAAPVEAGDAPELEPLPRTIEALDERLRGLGAALDTRELFLGELAERVLGRRGWARLGYASEEQYCRERLGTSAAAVKGWMMLAREGRRLPALDAAVRSGRIGSSVAQLIARVARPSTVAAWIVRA
ncbi:MAG: hypothetical protein KF901_33045, partial [Myxococcales bacterium]|nr:hypothetical protein [Myxococcales bacterium]